MGLFCIFGRGTVEPGFPNSFVRDVFPSLLVLEGGLVTWEVLVCETLNLGSCYGGPFLGRM